jgi:hypothetical protein
VNIGAPWPDLDEADHPVLVMLTKPHQWALPILAVASMTLPTSSMTQRFLVLGGVGCGATRVHEPPASMEWHPARSCSPTHRRLAPRPRVQRPHRSRQQPDQAHQAHRVRVPAVHPLPDPGPALGRQAQLRPTRHHHTPLKSDEPHWPAIGCQHQVAFARAIKIARQRGLARLDAG